MLHRGPREPLKRIRSIVTASWDVSMQDACVCLCGFEIKAYD
jgi:hypothetical protein